jgi:hypothetical protein
MRQMVDTIVLVIVYLHFPKNYLLHTYLEEHQAADKSPANLIPLLRARVWWHKAHGNRSEAVTIRIGASPLREAE